MGQDRPGADSRGVGALRPHGGRARRPATPRPDRIRAELDRLERSGPAGGSGQGGVHARGAARRAASPRPAGSSSPSLTGTARSRPMDGGGPRPQEPQRQRPDRVLSRCGPRGAGASGPARGDRRRAGDPRCRREAQLPGAPEARPALPRHRRAARGGRIAGGVLRLRPAGLRGPGSPGAPADRAEADPPDAAAAAGADPLRRSLRARTAPRSWSTSPRSGSKASSGRRRTRPTRAAGRPAGSRSGRSRPPISSWSGSPRRKGAGAASARCSWRDWVEGELVYAGRAGSRLQRQAARPGAEDARGHGAEDPACNGPRPWPTETEAPGRANARFPMPRTPPGSSRRWCARCSSRSGPRRACSASRCFSGSATTRRRRTAFGRAPRPPAPPKPRTIRRPRR